MAEDGDAVWLPAEIQAGDAPVAAHVSLVTERDTAEPTLPWAVTETVGDVAPEAGAVGWLAALRALPRPTSELAGRVNDRADQLRRAGEFALPGSEMVRSHAELADAVAQLDTSAWVLKGRFGSAGRERLRGRGTGVRDVERRRLTRLLATHGALLLEPWCERIADFGAIGLVGPGGVRRIGVHETVTAGGGAFRCLRPMAEEELPEIGALDAAVEHAGRALLVAGYTGPFGVDAWRYVDATGATRFHPLGEVNARLTFGFVARALVDRAGWDGTGFAPALHVGSTADFDTAAVLAPLVFPRRGRDLAAWLE